MIKKVFAIFNRDLKVSTRDFIALYIIIVPLLFALAINAFIPGFNDTTVNIGLVKGEHHELKAFLEMFAKVELFNDHQALERRILKRDALFGMVKENDAYTIIAQGDEPAFSLDHVTLLSVFYEQGISVDNSTVEIENFNRRKPPIKKMIVNGALMFISVLGGMLILLNIIEEKVDHTVSAINVSPISRLGFIAGKSMIGITFPIIGSIIMLFLTGYGNINFVQIIIVLMTLSVLSIVIGFVMGLTHDDMMSAAGNMKIMFLPLIGAIVAVEFLGEQWQKFFYWIPFYWAYKANDLVLSQKENWSALLSYLGIVMALSVLVFIVLAPKIRKGLE